jgi:hypothetical protein
VCRANEDTWVPIEDADDVLALADADEHELSRQQ